MTEQPFLDANVVFSAAWSPRNRLRSLWDLHDVNLLTSAYCLGEAERNLAVHRPKALEDFESLKAGLWVVPEAPSNRKLPREMILPDKDQPVFLAAMEAQATHFLTGDFKHFGAYRGEVWAGVLILAPADFLGPKLAQPPRRP